MNLLPKNTCFNKNIKELILDYLLVYKFIDKDFYLNLINDQDIIDLNYFWIYQSNNLIIISFLEINMLDYLVKNNTHNFSVDYKSQLIKIKENDFIKYGSEYIECIFDYKNKNN